MARLLDRVALVVTAVLVVIGLWNAPWESMAHFAGRYVRVLGDKLDPKGPPGVPCRDTDGFIATMNGVSTEILHELEDGGPGSSCVKQTDNLSQDEQAAAWKRHQTCWQRAERLRGAYRRLEWCAEVWRSKE
jgi:hypothetical protein